MISTCEALLAAARDGVPSVLVILVETVGSAPQDAGAKMLVSSAGLVHGTVGGGRVEAAALKFAQEMLAAGESAPGLVKWSLKGDIGMTCGGTVTFYFEPQPGHAAWTIAVFGAGHIAQALIPVLTPLPCRILVCDSRAEWLGRLPSSPHLTTHCLPNPSDLLPALPDNAFVLCMTQGHATDRPILLRCLTERKFPYLGAIGSSSKAAVLRRELVSAGVPPDRAASFHCPIGLDFGSNHPHEIALSIAAQLLSERDRLAKPISRRRGRGDRTRGL
jgi:xanthine dehydrogenase accessory factor